MSKTTTTTDTHRLIHFTDTNFESEVLESDQPVLVDFWANWCGPCHALAPTIEGLNDHYDGSIKVGRLDVDENPETAHTYGIRSIPTVLIFKNGEVIGSVVGVQPSELYEEQLNPIVEGV